MEADWIAKFPAGIDIHAIGVAPRRFEHFKEPSAYAEKMLGYDGDERCCYYQHIYTITREVPGACLITK